MAAASSRPTRPPPELLARVWRWANVPIPETYMAALLGALVLQRILRFKLPLARTLAAAVGGTMLVAGIGIAGWAVRSAGATDVARPSALITTGAYAVSRNPMYVGWSLGVLGGSIIYRDGWLLASWLLVTRALHAEILGEEARLARTFGNEYIEYTARVGRYWASARRSAARRDRDHRA